MFRISQRRWRFLFFCTPAVFLAWSDVALASDGPQAIIDRSYAQPQQLIEIEPHRRLNLLCEGAGTPTIIFDAGSGNDISTWSRVHSELAKRTRACAYDRAGMGFSDAALRAGTSTNIVDDLHRLLREASINPPYILVGHSYGGMNLVLYADLYFDEVAGMVLIDPTLENQVRNIRRYFPAYDRSFLNPSLQKEHFCVVAAAKGFVPETKAYDQCVPNSDSMFSDEINAVHVKQAQSLAYQEAAFSENEAAMTGRSQEQVRAARRGFVDLPLIILAIPLGPQPLVPGETQAMQDAIHAARGKELQGLARRSSKGIVQFIPNSGHFVQLDQPAIVVHAVEEVLRQVAH